MAAVPAPQDSLLPRRAPGQAGDEKPHSLSSRDAPQTLLNRLCFGWVHHIVGRAYVSTLTADDLPLPKDQHADTSYAQFSKLWAQEAERGAKRERQPYLLNVLMRQHGVALLLGALCKMLWSTCVILGAFFFVRSLLLYVDTSVPSPYDSDLAGFLLMVFFFIDAWLLGLALQRMGDFCLRVGVRIRAALLSAVSKKALSMATINQELTAEVVQFVASDINKVYDSVQQIHNLWTAPIEAVAILALLTSLTKVYALPGYVIVFAVLGLQYYFGHLIAKHKTHSTQEAARRLALAQEVLPCMKVVKYYCWESFFTSQLNQVRTNEQPVMWKLILIRSTAIALVFTTPPLTAFVIFTAYEFGVGKLTADLAFTTLSLFNILRFPLVVLPKAIRSASEGWSSLKRIEAFLLLPLELKDSTLPPAGAVDGGHGIIIEDGEFEHAGAKDKFKMSVAQFQVKAGEVVGVAGRVGSGKTSVINAIMGRMERKSGRVAVSGSVAYVRQCAWLQNISCRENILLGEGFEEYKYSEVVRACALETDFRMLRDGDMTKAGLRGVNLSGGQRQRINIARAAYSNADVMILDSPLSAVDYHTAHHIFNHCIKDMLKDKAVVLVTHSLDILPKCDKIAIMEGGKMVYFGPFTVSAVNQYLGTEGHVDAPLSSSSSSSVKPAASHTAQGKAEAGERVPRSSKFLDGVVIPGEASSCKVGYRQIMRASMKSYWIEGGVLIGLLSLFLYILAQSTRQMSDYWIRQWVNDTLKLYPNNESKNASFTYAMVYMGLMLAFGVFNWLRGFDFFIWTRKAANGFFRKYVDRTFHAPLAFFLNNPVGDLINVFSKDQDVIDENLPEALHFTGIYGLILLATVIIVSIVIPLFSAFAAALVFLSVAALFAFLPPATQLKMLTAESSGALTGLVAEALEGLDVIQAYGKQEYFIHEAERRADMYHRFFFNSESLNLWLSFYCDFFGAVLVAAVATFAVVQRMELGAANVGLAFSNVIQMLVFYTWVIRFLADTISFWGSAERISGLALATPSEADLAPPLSQPAAGEESDAVVVVADPSEWRPGGGHLVFENAWMRYRDTLPWALRGVSAEFFPKEKIGVVGRTGSGKSTLLLTLYRMFELGYGRIIYDGVDIASLPRDKLRKSLSIIPQEPLMFSGSLRSNLDPYCEKEDKQLWEVLEQVGLKVQAEAMLGGLSALLDGSSSEWSLGQKQLLCLARAALTNVPVLCLDEATAAMDPQTEVMVLSAIDKLFAERTMITIAHRLDVVIKGTRILVMDKGENMEIDTPHNLLSRPESMFSMLVDRSGPEQAAGMRAAAKAAALARGVL